MTVNVILDGIVGVAVVVVDAAARAADIDWTEEEDVNMGARFSSSLFCNIDIDIEQGK